MTTFSTSWPIQTVGDPRDSLSRDELLAIHQQLKDQIEELKKAELDLRKYIVVKAFPEAMEGTNTQELGNGYTLKAVVKKNYNLDNDNQKIWDTLERIEKIGNQGKFIAERLISWKPSFLLTEYRKLQEDANESEDAKAILREITDILTITDGTPTLEIKEPPKGRK